MSNATPNPDAPDQPPPRESVRCELEFAPLDLPARQRLRALLKVLGRRYGFRVTRIRDVPADPRGSDDDVR